MSLKLPIIFLLGLLLSSCVLFKPVVPDDPEQSIVTIKKEKAILGNTAYVKGSVQSHKNGEAISFAHIKLTSADGKLFGVLSNENGQFEFKKLSPGQYTLDVDVNSGHHEIHQYHIKLKVNKAYSLHIELGEIIMRLEKPLIYIYPEKPESVKVCVNLQGSLTHTYPKYPAQGWLVLAHPDGTLIDSNGQTYYGLFWEGEMHEPLQAPTGFVVAGKNTAAFLEEKLAYLGLNRREANEFIMHWLPRMENNPYNLIHFANTTYTQQAELHISPQPETLIRVMMLTQALPYAQSIPEQDLSPLHKTRKGFTVVEWGGTEITNQLP
jgi:hypothetical protein